MIGWLLTLFSSKKKQQQVIPLSDQLTELSDTEEDDEPLEWSQSEDFVNDVYVESDDENEESKNSKKQPRRAKPVLSRIKSMLAPSLRKKLPKSSSKDVGDSSQAQQQKVRKPKMKMKPPLPALPVRKQELAERKGKIVKKKKKKKKKAPKRMMKKPGLSDEDLLASKEYEQALRLHLANAEPYPEVDDDDDEVYSDHYIESDSEYEYSYEQTDDEVEELNNSLQSNESKDKYFSFSWDSHKQPSGVASNFSRNDMSLQEEEPIVGMGKDLSWKPPESKKNPAPAREEGGVDKHFSFTWQHKESTW